MVPANDLLQVIPNYNQEFELIQDNRNKYLYLIESGGNFPHLEEVRPCGNVST
ncbi:MAG: hypothetical protein WCL00_00985 [Bacteroidota bacterium]